MYSGFDQGSPDNAIRWVRGIEQAVQSLASLPERCVLAPESEVFSLEIRQLLFKSHRVLFVIKKASVHVIHVRHGARQSLDSSESQNLIS
ncbi:MAG: type II toxin-antitoxin system RelE/ParE family toxin [Pyrinomonadaceae bacterium]|nr:type II toxin-antitoxin system RelE/ParE family toxin [Phycisphaerales bacterium]